MGTFSKPEIQRLEQAALDKDTKTIAELYYQYADRQLRKYRHYRNYDDLRQAIVFGAIRSLYSYDPSKGKFLSWSSYYATTAMKREKIKIYPVKISEYYLQKHPDARAICYEYNTVFEDR